jgi:hypothetical protein
VDDVRARCRRVIPLRGEPGRRLFAAHAALAIGYCGVIAVAAATSMTRSTIRGRSWTCRRRQPDRPRVSIAMAWIQMQALPSGLSVKEQRRDGLRSTLIAAHGLALRRTAWPR